MLKESIYVQGLGCWNRLEKSGLIFLYNFYRKHSLLKLKIKKLTPKINVKNIKNEFFLLLVLVGYEP